MPFLPLTTSNSLGANYNAVNIALNDHETTVKQIRSRWQEWSPTYSNITVGNGTVKAFYRVFGKTCYFRYHLNCGTTSSVGNAITISLPVRAKNDYLTLRFSPIGTAIGHDNTVALYGGWAFIDGGQTNLGVRWNDGNAALNFNAPFVFGANDDLAVEGFYETE